MTHIPDMVALNIRFLHQLSDLYHGFDRPFRRNIPSSGFGPQHVGVGRDRADWRTARAAIRAPGESLESPFEVVRTQVALCTALCTGDLILCFSSPAPFECAKQSESTVPAVHQRLLENTTDTLPNRVYKESYNRNKIVQQNVRILPSNTRHFCSLMHVESACCIDRPCLIM